MITLGTAGHIDHGKTTLTGLLTGTDTDRLPEEKSRGISIDLGFARLETSPGRVVGLVDVPGHERFVHNMVAGVSGIHGYLLVLAADEGVMPQTREHLRILRLLGVDEGVVVLSKRDLVDADLVELVTEEIHEFLAAEEMPDVEVVAYSSRQPESVEPVREALERLRARLVEPPVQGLFRMPVDRTFSIKGHGTVATGTVCSGRVEVGQEVRFLPVDLTSRVRAVQTFEEDTGRAEAGSRAGLNVPDVGRDALPRGSVAVAGGELEAVSILDVRLELIRELPEAFRRLRTGTRMRVHLGTAQVPGRLHLLGDERLEAGRGALAQLRLSEPLVSMAGDRFLIRSLSPVLTLGGGTVLEAGAPRYKRGRAVIERLARIEREGTTGSLMAYLERSEQLLENAERLSRALHLPIKRVRTHLKELGTGVVARREGPGGPWYGAPRRVERAERLLLEAVKEYHARHPVEHGVPRDSLGRVGGARLAPTALDVLLRSLAAAGQLEDREGRVRLPGHEISYGEDLGDLRDKVLGYLEGQDIPFQGVHNLAEAAGVSDKAGGRLLDALVKGGELLRMPGAIFAPRPLVEKLRDRVLALLDERAPGAVSTQDLKAHLDLPRKALIPLLEGMDEAGLTLRAGNGRIRRPGSRR